MRRYRGTISSLSPSEVHTMKYVFGANHLFIGKRLYNVLSALEERYGIDFNELEEKFGSDN